MAKYQIWDRTSDIFTPSGHRFTPTEWVSQFQWLNAPGAKMIISAGVINGGCALEFDSYVENAKKRGAPITGDMTDEEVLAAIEAFEDAPPDYSPTVEERTAAALEFLAMNSLPDET